jgi:hypothetical protein
MSHVSTQMDAASSQGFLLHKSIYTMLNSTRRDISRNSENPRPSRSPLQGPPASLALELLRTSAI